MELNREEAAVLYREVCQRIFEEVLAGKAPYLSNGLCRLISKREQHVVCRFSYDTSLGYAVTREVLTPKQYAGYLGRQGVWTPERLGYLCGVVAMTERDWVARVNAGTPS